MEARMEHTGKTRTGIGDTGKLVIGGTVSTGLLLGGFAVAAMTLAGRMNANALLLTSLGLFLVGAVAGLVISAAVGVAGREDGVSLRDAGRQAGRGALYAMPLCLGGALLASWIGMAVISLYVGGVAPIALTILAAVVGAVIMAVTFKVTCSCCANLFDRIRK